MGVDPNIPPSSQPELRALEQQFLTGGVQVPVVASFDTLTAGRKGRIVFNSTESKFYGDTGSGWVALN